MNDDQSSNRLHFLTSCYRVRYTILFYSGEPVLSLITSKNFRATVRVTNAGGYKFSSPILLGKFGLKSIREAGSRSIIHKSPYFCSSLIIQGFYDVVKINPSKRYFSRCFLLSSFMNFSTYFNN